MRFGFEMGDVEQSPEAHLMDKARFKLLSRPRGRRKPKVWWLECQWFDLEAFDKHRHWLWDKEFIEHWHLPNPWGNKFMTLAGAKDHYKTMRPAGYFDNISGRCWRIKNIITGEIYLLQ
jgi:hypothetical protein